MFFPRTTTTLHDKVYIFTQRIKENLAFHKFIYNFRSLVNKNNNLKQQHYDLTCNRY